MTEDELVVARFLAQLANVNDISTLPAKEQRRLAGCLLRIPPVREALRAESSRLGGPKSGHDEHEVGRSYLAVIHSLVRDILPRLVDGVAVDFPVRRTAPGTWRVVGGNKMVKEQPPPDHVLDYFLHLSAGPRFPFGRCPTCQIIFARVRRQRYCSPTCKNKAFASDHQERRREYMRRLMAKRRRQERMTKEKRRDGRKRSK